MSLDAKARFFDRIADQWDTREDLECVAERLARGLVEFGVAGDERIVDVGCGTGNLTRALVERLTETGRVVAIDLSRRMIAQAQAKVPDRRIQWVVGDAACMPLSDDSVDRVICLSVWPHLEDRDAAILEFRRVLRPGGLLHVWHLDARNTVNGIHAAADPAVAGDILEPAWELAERLANYGLVPYQVMDDDGQYLVSARWPGGDG